MGHRRRTDTHHAVNQGEDAGVLPFFAFMLAPVKTLLIVGRPRFGGTAQLAQAARDGALATAAY